MIALVVLGILAFASTSECAITSWTTPVQAGTGGQVAAAILTLPEGYFGDLVTFVAVTDVTPISGYAIVSQDPASIFDIGATTGVLTLATNQVLDYETVAPFHILQIEALDSTGGSALVGTVTVTISITNVAPVFTTTKQTIEVETVCYPSCTTVTTVTAIDFGATLTYAITSDSNTNSDFAISSAGIVTTANIPAPSNTASYTLIITATDNVVTRLTGTTTLVVCIGTCPATCGGAAGHAAGILSLITLVVTMIK